MTCGADALIKIFDTETISNEPRTIESHDSPVNTLAINNKVRRIAASHTAPFNWNRENRLQKYCAQNDLPTRSSRAHANVAVV